MTQIMAPVGIVSMRVTRSRFEVGDRPADEMRLVLDVDFDAGDIEEREGLDEYQLSIILSVTSRLVSTTDEEDVRAEAMAEVATRVATSRRIGNSAKALEYLRLNGVSMAYAHARSYIMTMAALSPMGSLILPPILPEQLIKSQLGGDGPDEGGDGAEA
ncbi:hypothetical protein [Olsenella uli]|uniref:hypothetical protein n=1 Tax=Olsenella uli TaxID=133926 RepID=UPI002420050C|nr:hypothetical protein [Olsenella uli]